MTYETDKEMKQKQALDPFVNREKGSAAERIEGLMRGRGAREVSKIWGIPPSTLNSFLERKGDPKLSMLLAISRAEGVSLEWLATGEDQRCGNAAQPIAQQACDKELEQAYSANDMDHLVKVPTFNVEASAGAGAWINAENICDYWYVPRTWLRLERLEHAELCIINTVGDSMAPHINHGDRLLVKTNIDREKALEGVFVINLDGHLRVKRLEFTLSPIGYRVISDNELYPPEFVPAAELTQRLYVIGEVVRVFGQPAKPIQPIQ